MSNWFQHDTDLLLRDYQPKSQLVVSETAVHNPKYPVVDAHNHLGDTFGAGWIGRPVVELLDLLDRAGVEVLVDLDGGWSETILQKHLDHFKSAAPHRFVHFGGINWERWPDFGNKFGEWAAAHFENQVRWGAQGLKIWKGLGLSVRDHTGRLVAVDDPRLDPIWSMAGQLDVPVTVHVADPVAFFQPLDNTNERWEELQVHPDWHYNSPTYPSFMSILEAFARLIERHPQTTFIGAHVGCYVENLSWVSELLERAPNFYVDIGARIAELGRQPYSSRRFFLRYADRILFGTDSAPDLDMYRLYYRFLETGDEYFNYVSTPTPNQGRWSIYGLFLPDDVLLQVYYRNSNRVLRLSRATF